MFQVAGRRKLDREKILASLNVKCTRCGAIIPPDKQMRIDFERMQCPDCKELFKAEEDRH
jgi:ribosomal protein S26